MTDRSPPRLVDGSSPEQLPTIHALFVEYAASLDFDLCFQDFDQELAHLPGDYAPPRGRLLLATAEGHAVGCVGLRPLAEGACEMKRLYVQPAARGRGIGRALAETVITEAARLGYARMLLDTVPSMQAAIALYRDLGFRPTAPYRPNPVPGALFFELSLRR